ncbi:hypothetical protein [Thiocapsa roseopersicina]|uniref:Rap1a immunity protein domain-containing protein n=1 Tax=Thiocapsa roseopersicina TaxID=1058 RepID=A0A1H2WLB7_THIRO|nr:hypothetical protein [Thiocapsa roseopersicina]SDW81422.1 hypothetical protein SAMN05421783_10917 [Thiocapsa roseopersicina]
MRFPILTGLLLMSTGLAFADPTESTEVGFPEVRTLGTLNGQALACRQFDASSEAKALIIGYAPKTRRYGTLFETATNAAFLAATKDDAPCPTAADLAARLAESAEALKAVFPEQANPEQAKPEQAKPEPSEPQPPGAEPSLSNDETGS